jgi:hypothetical protein
MRERMRYVWEADSGLVVQGFDSHLHPTSRREVAQTFDRIRHDPNVLAGRATIRGLPDERAETQAGLPRRVQSSHLRQCRTRRRAPRAVLPVGDRESRIQSMDRFRLPIEETTICHTKDRTRSNQWQVSTACPCRIIWRQLAATYHPSIHPCGEREGRISQSCVGLIAEVTTRTTCGWRHFVIHASQFRDDVEDHG